jgi:flagellar L-ring protein precursor FlgH
LLLWAGGSLSPADILYPVEQAAQASSWISDPPKEVRVLREHDLVTIQINDLTQFVSRMQLNLSKETTMETDLEEFFNMNGRRGTDTRRLKEGNLQLGHETEGDGNERKRIEIRTTVTAEVVEVRPNGTYGVEARRVKQVDRSKTTITLSGVIRPEDVSLGNTIGSDRVADLRFAIKNEGPTAQAAGRGWFGRILDWAWPF